MKHLKMLGLLLAASASLMAFASSASATAVLTSPAGTDDYTGTILASASTAGGAAGSLTLKASVFTATCGEGTVHGTVTTNNTTHAIFSSAVTFGDCDSKVVVIAAGAWTINDAGEVFLVGGEWTFEKFGFSCVYGGGASPGAKVGTLITGTTASLTIAAKLPWLAGSPFCSKTGEWSGKYTITTPDSLFIT